MKFWDSSAIVPLLLYEKMMTESMTELFRSDSVLIVWWATDIECISALSRLEREQKIDHPIFSQALTIVNKLKDCWHQIQPTTEVKEMAMRLLRVHHLHAADALQLAAAIVASNHQPRLLEFVCLDRQLAIAAHKEGFPLMTTL